MNARHPPPAPPPRVTAIQRFGLTTPDADRLAEFYERAFDCRVVSNRHLHGAEFDALMRVPGGARELLLTLSPQPPGPYPVDAPPWHVGGAHTLELLQFADPGRAYPPDLSPFDNIFQHFAIVVRDMTRAMQRLARLDGWTPISLDGPQRLPASAGGVTAFKFRDPDGHPLEFLEFPEGAIPRAWRAARSQPRQDASPALRAANGSALAPAPPPAPRPAAEAAPDQPLFLGIDHSAVSVHDPAASIAFYRRLGLEVTARNLNQGREQHLLDGIRDPHVDVVTLSPPQATPHVELLGYRATAPRPQRRLSANDTAATRIVFITDSACAERVLEDPDGHRLHFVAPQSGAA